MLPFTEDIFDALIVGGLATAFYYYRMNKFENQKFKMKDIAILFAFSVIFEFVKTFFQKLFKNNKNGSGSEHATKDEVYKLYLDLNNKINKIVTDEEYEKDKKIDIDQKYNPLNPRPSRAIDRINEHFTEAKKKENMYDIRPSNFF